MYMAHGGWDWNAGSDGDDSGLDEESDISVV
jgi:hypothetical protein